MASRRPTTAARPLNPTAPYRLILTNGVKHRSLVIGPWFVSITVFLVFGVAAWCVGLTSYVYFKDDVLRAMTQAHSATVERYEDDLASLRLSVDRIRGRQFVNQGSFETVLGQLQDKQTQIEDYQRQIYSLVKRMDSAELKIDLPQMADTTLLTGSTTGSGAGQDQREDTADNALTILGHASTGHLPRSRPALPPRQTLRLGQFASLPSARIVTQMDAELSSLAADYSALLNAYEDAAIKRVDRYKGIFQKIGLPKSRFGIRSQTSIGGPFIPLDEHTQMSALDLQLARIDRYIDHAEEVETTVRKLPIQRPVSSSFRMTSRFGPRIDPFVRRRAFHSGLDFATPTGTRILATGSGRVARAGWMGGYGRMVEINHGNGLSTRYAHLSRISVKSGQRVAAGDVIGRAGSTGRSTGPHLHYETRIDGKAVDPMRFLSAL